MTRILAPLLLLVGVCMAQPAFAECQVQLQAPPQVGFMGTGGQGYDGSSSASFSFDFTITIRNRSQRDSCSMLLSLQHPTGVLVLVGDSGGSLTYRVTDGPSSANIVDSETLGSRPPNAILIELEPGEHEDRQLRFFIPTGQIVASGRYSDTILVRALSATDFELLAERSTQLRTRVRQQVAIFISDTSFPGAGGSQQRGTLDFGTLQSNESASLGVTIVSNDSYGVRLESENSGALWHTLYGSEWKIGYDAYFGDKRVPLNSGVANLTGYPSTQRQGTVKNLRVQIGEVGGVRAGRYADTLTITVVPDV